jgi:two-component sensor histidine kinase
MQVMNTGDQLPPDFDPKSGQLGLQIIRSLSSGLGGEFAMETRDGRTVAELKFRRATAE